MTITWPAVLALIIASGLAIVFDRYKDVVLMAWILLAVVGGWRASRGEE